MACGWLEVTPSQVHSRWLPGGFSRCRRRRWGWLSGPCCRSAHLQPRFPEQHSTKIAHPSACSQVQVRGAWKTSKSGVAVTCSCSVSEEGSSPGDADVQSASRSVGPVDTCLDRFYRTSHFGCDLKGIHFTSLVFLRDKNNMCMCLRPQHPSAQRTGRMLWRSTCIFLCFLPSSLHSHSLSRSLVLVLHIHSCDCPANEMMAPTVGTCFHLGGE